MRRRPETNIRLGIKDVLKQLGFSVWDMEQNRRTRQTPGFSDLVACGHGMILFIECKTKRGRLTDAQKVFGDAIGQNGGIYLVWRSATDAWDYLVEAGIIKEAA